MDSSFEQTLVEVWRQALVENANVVVLGTERYPVRYTPKRRQPHFVVVDFTGLFRCRCCGGRHFIPNVQLIPELVP